MTDDGQRFSASPRAARSEWAILDATRELLAEGGVRQLTVEGARGSIRVSKTTIYRRWRSKNDLALAVLLDVLENEIATVDLGNTRDEALFLVDAAVAMLGTTPLMPITQGLVSDLATDAQLAQAFRSRVVAARLAEVAVLVVRGVARGDLRADTDHELMCELLFGPVYYRLLLSGAESTDMWRSERSRQSCVRLLP